MLYGVYGINAFLFVGAVFVAPQRCPQLESVNMLPSVTLEM